MQDYLCQMQDYDVPEEWTAVRTFDANDAAREYAKICDERSGGDMFQHYRDRQIIFVKQDGAHTAFEVSAEHEKLFYARRVDDSALTQEVKPLDQGT